jgi:hypothetical protein
MSVSMSLSRRWAISAVWRHSAKSAAATLGATPALLQPPSVLQAASGSSSTTKVRIDRIFILSLSPRAAATED